MVNLRPFQNFIRVVELGSISRAASQLGIAQPALSTQILGLEAELGVKLLDRSTRGVEATNAGKTLYRHAKSLLARLEDARQDVRASARDIVGKVSIGMPASTSEVLAVPLLKKLRADFPHLRPLIAIHPSQHLEELLINGRLDIGVTFESRNQKGLNADPLLLEELFFVVPVVGRPNDRKPRGITMEELAQHALIVPALPNSGRLMVEAAAAQAGVELNVIAEINTSFGLLEATAGMEVATILPWSGVLRRLPGTHFVKRPFLPKIERHISLSISDGLPLSAAAHVTHAAIRSLTSELATSGFWQGIRLL